jgi:hypothetical protein
MAPLPPYVPPVPKGRPTYSLILVNQAGGERIPLVRAQVLSVMWELDGWGEMRWAMGVMDPQLESEPVLADADSLTTPREVQLWRNGRLIWWGIPTGAPSCDGNTVTFTAYGLLWYFARRYFGPTFSNTMPQLISNGSFEADPINNGTGIGGWGVTGATATASTTRHKVGTRSVRLQTFGASNQYMVQSAQLPSPARSRPLVVTASVWVYPESIVVPNSTDRGLGLAVFADQTKRADAPLSANVPMGRWTRLECSLELEPADTTEQLVIVLHAPDQGVVLYDAARCTYQQRTGALEGQDWSDDYLRRLLNYGAGNSNGGSTGPGGTVGDQTQWWGSPVRKSSLNIPFVGSSFASRSLVADVFWDHEDHGQIYEAMMEVVKRDICDFEIVWNETGTVRQFVTYPPRKGSLRRHMLIELDRDISSLSYTVDGRGTANDVRVVANNPGDTKEVGQAGGPIPHSLGGLQLESVLSAADEVEGQGLVETALWEERTKRRPVPMPSIRVPAGPYLDPTQPGGPLSVGDSVPVRVRRGWLRDVSVRRVVQMTLNAATDELELVVNV